MALSICDVKTSLQGRELVEHGSALFPVACYHDNLTLKPVPWHWHDELEVLVIAEGAAMISAGSEKYSVKQGEGFFVNAGSLHSALALDNRVCRLHSVVFHPRLVGGSMDSIFWQNYIQPLLQNTLLKSIHLDCSALWHREFIDAAETAWQSAVTETAGYEFQVRNALSQLVLLLSSNQPWTQSCPSGKELRDTGRIKIMMQYIQEHYMEALTTSQIAKSIMVSESECLRCFHNTIGTPPIQFVKQFRIQKAAEELAATNKKIGDISADCGFQDTSYFIKTFRQLKGCTPGEYRKQNRKPNVPYDIENGVKP